MLQINDVIPLKWKLLVEDDVLSTTTTTTTRTRTEARVRTMKEKRDSKCQPGKFIFIVQCWQWIASGLAFRVIREDFLRRKRSLDADPACGFSSVVFRHSWNAWGFLPTFSPGATRDEGASLLHGIKKRLSRSFFPRDDDRQPSQINSLSGGIISPKWPFINERPTGPAVERWKSSSFLANFPTEDTVAFIQIEDFRVSFAVLIIDNASAALNDAQLLEMYVPIYRINTKFHYRRQYPWRRVAAIGRLLTLARAYFMIHRRAFAAMINNRFARINHFCRWKSPIIVIIAPTPEFNGSLFTNGLSEAGALIQL